MRADTYVSTFSRAVNSTHPSIRIFCTLDSWERGSNFNTGSASIYFNGSLPGGRQDPRMNKHDVCLSVTTHCGRPYRAGNGV